MNPVVERTHPNGVGEQRIYRFDNGYGASVVRTPYSYGGPELWELAVLIFTDDDPLHFKLTYDTPITDDVIGWLDETSVVAKLRGIEALA